MEIADDELGGASVTESALFAAAAGRSLVNAGRKLAGGLAKRVAQALCCFAAGTLVATAEGLRPIEDLEVGDQVWARSEETQELALKPVTALIRPHERVIWTVVYEIDEGTGLTYAEFDTTDDHPWASTDGTWLRTDELKPGMQIQRAHGVPARVMSVVETGRTEQTYNLEVADFHTYFVGEAWVWVHNAANCGIAGQIHHIASDKAIKSGFTEQFRRIFGRADKSLQDAANKVFLEGHAGRHSPKYHQYVLGRLQTATRGLSGDAYSRALDGELGALRGELLRNPDLVRGVGL